jgi:SAM-dependent methyltransferase
MKEPFSQEQSNAPSYIDNPYRVEPLSFFNDIPVFSASNSYIKNYEKISSDHVTHFELTGHNPFMNEAHWKDIEQSTSTLIKKYITGSKAKILDVGVGMGRLFEDFSGHDLYGMDISKRYLQYSKSKGINVCLSLIEDMPYKNEYFDVVISTDVLEHVFDLNASIKMILAVLKAGGLLFVRVPIREDLSPYLADNFPYNYVHIRNFDENNLRLLFEKVFNLKILELTPAGLGKGCARFLSSSMVCTFIMRRIRSLACLFGPKVSSFIARLLFYPAEINVVLAKETSKDLLSSGI